IVGLGHGASIPAERRWFRGPRRLDRTGTMHYVRRRQFLLATGALLVEPIVAQTQSPTKPYRIGVLRTDDSQALLQESLRELGYVEGRDVVFEIRSTEGRSERLDDFARVLVRLKVNVIVGVNSSSGLSSKRVTASMPL